MSAASLRRSANGSVALGAGLNRVALVTAGMMMLTSSFDTFLVIQVGGTFRICQLVAPILFFLAALKVCTTGMLHVLGARWLATWALFQILFIPIAAFWPKSLAYALWLVLNLGTMVSFVQLFSADERALASLLRWYAASFGVVAAFGIIQFALPLLGFPAPLVTQWWIPERVVRANGFSYEPSYFATYLLIGFVFFASLRHSRSPLLPSKALAALYWLTLTGIVVSSSRMGLVFLLLDLMLYPLGPWADFLRGLARGRLCLKRVRALMPSLGQVTVLLGLLVAGEHLLESDPATALLFLNGTGISDTAAHSVVQRQDAFMDTLRVFAQHPFWGQSLGGVSSAIAELHAERIGSFEDSKAFEGMNVFAEALAASGLAGMVPLLFFVTETIRRPLRLARSVSPVPAGLLRALVRSLVFAWAILQFNQNLLRPYLWVHLSVLATVYAATPRLSSAARARTAHT